MKMKQIRNDLLLLINDGLMEATIENEFEIKDMAAIYERLTDAIDAYFEDKYSVLRDYLEL